MTRPETVQVPAMRVVGISIRTSNQAETDALHGEGAIARAWQAFGGLELERKIPNPHVSGEVVAVYHDYEGNEHAEYTLTIGLRVTSLHQVPDDLVGIEVPFQTYARFPVEGPPDQAIGEMWESIHSTGLDRTYMVDLEIYQPGGTSESVKAEILVAVTDA